MVKFPLRFSIEVSVIKVFGKLPMSLEVLAEQTLVM